MLTNKEDVKAEPKNSKTLKSNSSSNSSLLSASKTSASGISCCQPPAKTPNRLPAKTDTKQCSSKQNSDLPTDKKQPCSKTRITIKYDAGFPNQLYIRGKGANLCWDKGHPLKNVKADEWTWETDEHFNSCEFKILINDSIYETGDNHHLNSGKNLLITPHFC